MMIMFGECLILIFLRDKIIILEKTTADSYVRGGKVPFDNQWKNRGGER